MLPVELPIVRHIALHIMWQSMMGIAVCGQMTRQAGIQAVQVEGSHTATEWYHLDPKKEKAEMSDRHTLEIASEFASCNILGGVFANNWLVRILPAGLLFGFLYLGRRHGAQPTQAQTPTLSELVRSSNSCANE